MNKKLIIAIVSVLALSSCRTDMKLAKAFVAEHTGIQAAVYFPEQADVKVEYNTQYERKTEALDGFSQDLFLDVMYDAYADAMNAYGVNVYVPSNANNVQVDSVHWLVMLSRMEISGRITEYEDYFFSDNDEYCYKTPLNTVNVASWFEVSDGEWKPVLFCEHNLMDGFESKASYSFWTSQIEYNYTIDTLKLKDVYNYAVYLGKLYAGYTYDYMMNDYVDTEMAKKNNDWNRFPLRYDPYKRQVIYAEEGDWFIEIK